MNLTETELAEIRATAEATMGATCRFETEGAGTWDPVDGATPGEAVAFWQGQCRVKAAGPATTTTATGGVATVTQRPYRVAVPFSTPVPPSTARVRVLTHRDPSLADAVLTIDSVTYGSLTAERVIYCTLEGGPDDG